ncbi:hypothetical protein LCGC14_2203480 [marine sediment metagenome]|uniref:Uncharacterized protein n=1 Tax=marine sediment metagenome TaxID=412755 RepID=A0A0F9GBP4_9ZZZZ
MKDGRDTIRNVFPSADEPDGPGPAPLLMAGDINAGLGSALTELQEGVMRVVRETGVPVQVGDDDND